MDISISCRHTQLSDRDEAAVRERVERLARYLDRVDRAEVVFDEERNPRIEDKEHCEIALEGNGHHLRAKATAPDPMTALERAAHKLERQLRKEKTKTVERRHVEGRRRADQARAEATDRLDSELSA